MNFVDGMEGRTGVNEYDDVEDGEDYGLDPLTYDGAATAPVEDMQVLHQLQHYQYAIRYIFPFLDAYEASVLIQIIDRITGWKKRAAHFSSDALYAGDRMYGGLGRTMDRSRMMKALRSLEERGVIARRRARYGRVRIFEINYDVDQSLLAASARPLSKSVQSVQERRMLSRGDNAVPVEDPKISRGEYDVSQIDTGEVYRENGIMEGTIENWPSAVPAAPASAGDKTIRSTTGEEGPEVQAPPDPRQDVDPPRRYRRS